MLLAKTAQTLYALAPESGSILWEFSPYGPQGETLYSQPVLDGNFLYIGDRRGWLHCLDVKDGKTIWRHQTSGGPNCDVNATAVVIAGLVITANNAGLAMAYASENGRPVWQGKLDGPCINHVFRVGKQVVAAAESLHFFDPLTGEPQGRVNWPGFGVSYAAGTLSNVVLFTRSLLAGWESCGPVERDSEILFMFEGTRPVREMRCSRYAHAARYSSATGLLYTSGLMGVDILNPETGEWLHALRPPERAGGCGLPEVAENRIYALDGSGVVYGLQHPILHDVRA
jgi:hypothetical protein